MRLRYFRESSCPSPSNATAASLRTPLSLSYRLVAATGPSSFPLPFPPLPPSDLHFYPYHHHPLPAGSVTSSSPAPLVLSCYDPAVAAVSAAAVAE